MEKLQLREIFRHEERFKNENIRNVLHRKINIVMFREGEGTI